MNFSDGRIDMYVEVTEKYRSIFQTDNLKAMITGNGFGKIIGFESNSDHDYDEKIFSLKWSNGYTSAMHPIHLQLSTKKAFFVQVLRG